MTAPITPERLAEVRELVSDAKEWFECCGRHVIEAADDLLAEVDRLRERKRPTVKCDCGKVVALRIDGSLRNHWLDSSRRPCPASSTYERDGILWVARLGSDEVQS